MEIIRGFPKPCHLLGGSPYMELECTRKDGISKARPLRRGVRKFSRCATYHVEDHIADVCPLRHSFLAGNKNDTELPQPFYLSLCPLCYVIVYQM